MPLWVASTEVNFLKDLKVMVSRPSSLTVIRLPAQQIRCIKFKMVCLGAVLMEALFRTPQSRQTGQESSWMVLNPAKILRL